MRYAWDQFDAYFGPERVGWLASRGFYRPLLGRLARWDAATASRPNRFVANSQYVAGRIGRYYNRQATIVYPPVDTVFFHPASAASDSHFLIVSALVPYKRIDLAIAACGRLGVPLRIAGSGPDRERLERRAGREVTFLGSTSDDALREEYRRARAVLLPGEEDFGIVPVEAQACGTPVVALGKGGALETVKDGTTGVLFEESTVESLTTALERVALTRFDRAAIRAHAEQFSYDRHMKRMGEVLDETIAAPRGTRW
jgi:glycosyltransferase involved in cell wall biosynthesis